MSSITSCQANQLLSLQRELMDQGLTVTVGECASSCSTTPATAAKATRRTATRKQSVAVAETTAPRRRGRPPKSASKAADTTTSAGQARKMSAAGKKSIASASTAYHAKIRDLRETGGLTQKQARARYQELKSQGSL